MMAIESGLPVVPVAIDGSRFVMRKGQLMTCPGDVHVTVLDPIPTAGRTPDQARQLARQVQAAVQGVLTPGAPPAVVDPSGVGRGEEASA